MIMLMGNASALKKIDEIMRKWMSLVHRSQPKCSSMCVIPERNL